MSASVGPYSKLEAQLIGNVLRTPLEHNLRLIFGILWLLAPLAIFAAASVTNKEMGANVPWRPPSETYIVAWCFIITSLMAAWVLVNRSASNGAWTFLLVGFFTIIGLATGWAFAFDKNPSFGISVFISLLMVAFMVLPVAYKASATAAGLLMPLIVWSIFQFAVNCAVTSYPDTVPPKTLQQTK